ncbi:MAG: penicillin-binding protein 1A [Saprospiraceae bacterium]|nr:MAG: penicillin-binding protein 1A [Saprospiraceae bacterium]
MDLKPILEALRNSWLNKRVVAPMRARYARFEKEWPRTGRVIRYGAYAFAGLVGLLLLLFLLVWMGAFGRLPNETDLRNLNQNIASEVYAEDGELLGKYFIENRLPADLSDIPDYVVNALIATEDARFFEHNGVDLRAWVRVFLRTVLMLDRSGGGGSTLSQQLAKNLFPRKRLGPLTIPVAKLKEIIIARRLESVYDKEQLIALYLNTVSFGDNIYGIRVASQRFFDSEPSELTPEQAALLIGMLKGPSLYHPVRNPERAVERRNVVLQQMVKYNYLEPAVADSLKALPLQVRYSHESHNEGLATYFRGHLRLQIDQLLADITRPDGRPYNLYTDGLKIYTTIDSRMQRYAEQAVEEHMKQVQKNYYEHLKNYRNALPWGSDEEVVRQMHLSDRYKLLKEKGLSEVQIAARFEEPVSMRIFDWDAPNHTRDTLMSPLDSIRYYLSIFNTGFLAIEPATGKVKAWVGGIDFKFFKYDHVKARRQVGSTFKPFVYAVALQQGIEPCERFENELRSYQEWNGWAPRNVDGKYGGTYSMRGALSQSVNTVAVELIMRTGIEPVRSLARQMGIQSEIPREPGIALGAVDASLYEMVRAFGTFANGGKVPEPWYLVRIENAEGDTLYMAPRPDPRKFPQVLDARVSQLMTYLLESVVNRGTAARLRSQYGFGWPVAGKTGTTNNNSDGWFVGYTPRLAFGAWVGASQPIVRFRSTRLGQGAATALPICGKFLYQVYRDNHFRSLRSASFPPLDSTTLQALDCPDYIPSDSVLIDSFLALMELPEDSLVLARKLELAHLIIAAFGEDVALQAPGIFNIDALDRNPLPSAVRRELRRLMRLEQDELEELEDEVNPPRSGQRRRSIFERIFGRKKDGG